MLSTAMTMPDQTRVATLPNALSATRLVLGPIAFYLIVDGRWLTAALVVMIIAELTDMCDGFLARTLNQTTLLGKILDPLADSFYRMCIFVALFAAGYMQLAVLSIFIWRDLGVAFVRVFAQENGLTLAARWSGKLKAVLQGIAQIGTIIIVLVWGRYAPSAALAVNVLIGLAAAITLYSFYDYLAGTRAAVRAGPNRGETQKSPPRPNGSLAVGVLFLGTAALIVTLASLTTTAAAIIVLQMLAAGIVGFVLVYWPRPLPAGSSGAGSASLAIFLVTIAGAAALFGPVPAWFVLVVFAHELAVPYLSAFLRQNGASDHFSPHRPPITYLSVVSLLVLAFAAPQNGAGIASATLFVALIVLGSLVWNCKKTWQALTLMWAGPGTTSS
jgi:CDP-diacylglycerol---glycerol-3-phosphate 3-phosphatidyltransferase